MTQEETFKNMLMLDQYTYANIVKLRAFLIESFKPIGQFNINYKANKSIVPFKTAAEASAYIKVWTANKKKLDDLQDRYNKRQSDYRNNTVYKLGQSITNASNSIVQKSKAVWDKLKSLMGLGIAPALIVPIATVTGAVLVTTVIAYFIYKYQKETAVDYNDGLAVIAELSKTNPALAEQMLDDLNNQQSEQSEGWLEKLQKNIAWLGAAAIGGILLLEYTGKTKLLSK